MSSAGSSSEPVIGADGQRCSGLQLHITALPSGTLGPEAHAFVDWLARAGQSWWQVLPLNPPDRFGSPYKSRSAFACSPRLLHDPAAKVSAGEEDDFRERHGYWIGDWAAAAGGRRAVHAQVRFEREWNALRRHAAEVGVRLLGDIPLYVAPDGVDHRRHPEIFARGLLGGAPPDRFNATGQLWGNPIYDWPALRRQGYRWWVERLRRAVGLFDAVRLDHFRGLVAAWAVPAGARDARSGRWRRGPGAAPLLAARDALGRLPLLAEDLGVITPPVERLRRELAVPGMVVLQFLYDRPQGDPLESLEDRVLYTATHDQDTLAGWWEGLPEDLRATVGAALAARSIRLGRGHWSLIELAMSSSASLVMAQVQDVLGLGSQARTNTPGRARGNWSWRLQSGALDGRLARRLRSATGSAGRLPA